MLRFRFHRSFHRLGWEIYVFRYDLQTRKRRQWKVTVELSEPQNEGSWVSEPSAFFPRDEFHGVLTALKDGLAESGLLKSTGALELQLQATQSHLQDMRALVFKAPMPKGE
jgi:hypothetical protein